MLHPRKFTVLGLMVAASGRNNRKGATGVAIASGKPVSPKQNRQFKIFVHVGDSDRFGGGLRTTRFVAV